MNIRLLARVIGGFVLLLGIFGLIVGETQFANTMNTDIMLDVLRMTLGAILIVSSMRSEQAAKMAFAFFGIVYLGNFLMALMSPSMIGLLPHEFGLTDNLLHLVGGLAGLGLAFMPTTKESRTAQNAA